jgi:multiple sugar transport system substrate-binding protein
MNMKQMKWTGYIVSLVFILAIAALGCSNAQKQAQETPQAGTNTSGDKASSPQTSPPKEITVTLFSSSASLSEENFKASVADPVKKKFPHITVKLINQSDPKDLENRVVSGELPDIVQAAPGGLSSLLQLNIMEDLQPYIKKSNFDLNRLKPEVVKGVQVFAKDKFLFMPTVIVPGVMYYNQDIFDKFGTPYPKDGMTWPQTIDLAKKLTIQDNGVSYRGLGAPIGYQLSNNQLSLSTMDVGTGKATIDTAGWKNWFDVMSKIYAIEGNQAKTKAELDTVSNLFSKDKTVAMLAWASNTYSRFADVPGLKWDMATFPVFPGLPDTNIQLNANFLAMTTTSKQKDDAFKVISVLLSDEVQEEASKQGQLSVLKKAEINNAFAKDVAALKGKNVVAIYKPKLATPVVRSSWDGQLRGIVTEAFWQVVSGKEDINTALRNAQDTAQTFIDSQNKK